MKKEQRAIWQQLANIPNERTSGLCSWCKFSKWSGSACCDDVDMKYTHPIDKIAEHAWDVWGGDDCWAFRPLCTFESFVDAVGLCLQGIQPDYESIE